MASNAEILLLDTSAALALVDPANECHDAVLNMTHGRLIGLSGHAAFELFSVLTRLPFPARLSGVDASRLIAINFPETRYLDARHSALLPAEFADLGIVGQGRKNDVCLDPFELRRAALDALVFLDGEFQCTHAPIRRGKQAQP